MPKGLDRVALIDRIPVGKDVDGLTTMSAGLLARGEYGLRPCTPSGVIALLDAEPVPIRWPFNTPDNVGQAVAYRLCLSCAKLPLVTLTGGIAVSQGRIKQRWRG